MARQRTFVDNWLERNNDIFQIIISDEINNVYNGDTPEETVIEKETISDTESVYFIEDEPIMKVVFDPTISKETIYVRDRRRVKRRSKITSPTISLPVARVKAGKI